MNYTLPIPASRAPQRGFSLIELMVAITVALFVLAGLTSVASNMKTTFLAQDGLAQLQDSERLVFTMMTTTVQSAGYYVDPVNDTVITALPASTISNTDGTRSTFVAGQAITGTTATAGDTLDVRYQTASQDGLMNCQGTTNTTGSTQVWVNRFAVNAVTHELTCAINGGSPVVLVSNVSKFTVLYGVDTDDDGSVDTYMNATDVTSGNWWGTAYTAQVSVVFMNPLYPAVGASTRSPWVQTISLMNKV